MMPGYRFAESGRFQGPAGRGGGQHGERERMSQPVEGKTVGVRCDPSPIATTRHEIR
jgi:hypothetical protein